MFSNKTWYRLQTALDYGPTQSIPSLLAAVTQDGGVNSDHILSIQRRPQNTFLTEMIIAPRGIRLLRCGKARKKKVEAEYLHS